MRSLYTDADDEEQRAAALWMSRVGREWAKISVLTHPKKAVDDGQGHDIQGARVHPTRHTVGLSGPKTAALMAAGCWLLTQWRPSRHALERVTGKVGFCHTFRSGCRGSLGCIYS